MRVIGGELIRSRDVLTVQGQRLWWVSGGRVGVHTGIFFGQVRCKVSQSR